MFSRTLPVAGLITHRFPLEAFEQALSLAARPHGRFAESGDDALMENALMQTVTPKEASVSARSSGHMTAAVLYGSENLTRREYRHPAPGAG